jgi:hypothetical protein
VKPDISLSGKRCQTTRAALTGKTDRIHPILRRSQGAFCAVGFIGDASKLRITRESQTGYLHSNFLLPRIPAASRARRIPALLLDSNNQSVLRIHTAGLARCCVDILLVNGVPMVIGPWTEPFDAHLSAGTNILGARCHPGLASSLLGVPASELLNLSMPLCDLWGSGGSSAYSRIADQTALVAQVSAMERALLARIANANPIDNTIREGIQWIARHPHERVERLSHWLGLSSRQIQRRFMQRWDMVRKCSSPCSVSSVFSILQPPPAFRRIWLSLPLTPSTRIKRI